MKNFEMFKIVGISMLVLALTVVTGTSVSAQGNTFSLQVGNPLFIKISKT